MCVWMGWGGSWSAVTKHDGRGVQSRACAICGVEDAGGGTVASRSAGWCSFSENLWAFCTWGQKGEEIDSLFWIFFFYTHDGKLTSFFLHPWWLNNNKVFIKCKILSVETILSTFHMHTHTRARTHTRTHAHTHRGTCTRKHMDHTKYIHKTGSKQRLEMDKDGSMEWKMWQVYSFWMNLRMEHRCLHHSLKNW